MSTFDREVLEHNEWFRSPRYKGITPVVLGRPSRRAARNDSPRLRGGSHGRRSVLPSTT